MLQRTATLDFTFDQSLFWIELGDGALRAGRYAEAEAWYRQALEARPDDTDLLNNLGTAVWFLGQLDNAEEFYRRAHQAAPESHSYVNNLGNIQRARGLLEQAEESYRKALKIQPDSIEARINLGVILSDRSELDESERLLREAISSHPNLPDAHLNLGTTLSRLGRWDEAIASYEEAIRLRPNFAEAHRSRAMYRLGLGDFERGWPEYEWRWRCQGKGLPVGDRPLWNGEPLQGKSILLHAEQGLGDTLQFVRYAKLVKQLGAEVTVVCAGPLVRLLKRCPGIDHVLDAASPLPPTDFQLLLMSLPSIFRTTLASIPAEVPYFSVASDDCNRWKEILRQKSGIKVGIAWQGNPQFLGDRRRSFPLTQFETLASQPGVRLIRLQHGHGSEQLDRLDGRFEVEDPFTKAGLENWDFLDSAALIKNLDLVVTADSSIGHLTGSLGVPVWLALPFASEWRWLRNRSDSPWYPSMRLFRQGRAGDWDEVFKRISEGLKEFRRLPDEGDVS